MGAKETVAEIVKSHNMMSLATLDEAGLPVVRSVDFTATEEENVLCFVTHKDSNKVKQIRANATVAISVDHDCPTMDDLMALKYIKGKAKASIIADPAEMQKVFGLLLQKFPFFKDLPGEPSDFVGVRIEMLEMQVTDHTIGYGNTETVTY